MAERHNIIHKIQIILAGDSILFCFFFGSFVISPISDRHFFPIIIVIFFYILNDIKSFEKNKMIKFLS